MPKSDAVKAVEQQQERQPFHEVLLEMLGDVDTLEDLEVLAGLASGVVLPDDQYAPVADAIETAFATVTSKADFDELVADLRRCAEAEPTVEQQWPPEKDGGEQQPEVPIEAATVVAPGADDKDPVQWGTLADDGPQSAATASEDSPTGGEENAGC